MKCPYNRERKIPVKKMKCSALQFPLQHALGQALVSWRQSRGSAKYFDKV